MGVTMKVQAKLVSCTAGLAFALMAGAAIAGEEPYVAVVGDDQGILRAPVPAIAYENQGIDCEGVGCRTESLNSLEEFYLEPKLYQAGFTHPNTYFVEELFDADNVLIPYDRVNTEICDNKFDQVIPAVNRNVRARSGAPADWFSWDIVVPKDPLGSINIVLQCGVVKPNQVYVVAPNPADNCAGETGEKVKPSCTNAIPGNGKYLKPAALPTLTAMAYPGEFNFFEPFHLTAIRNPSNYGFPKNEIAASTKSVQLLDGSNNARVTLKSCMPKTILVKLPIEGIVNGAGETEASLIAGDVIHVRMDYPSAATMDLYCNAYSAKVMGIGDPISLIANTSNPPLPPRPGTNGTE
jgi:hypothetical protein